MKSRAKTTPAPTQPPAPSPLSPRKLFWFKIAALLVLPILFAGLLETGLRLAGFGYNPAFFVKGVFTPDLVSNQHFGKRFFPRALARKPDYASIASTRPENQCRIFVFGESAALGDPDPKFGFARILGALLRERYPDIHFDIINTSMVAINSHVVRPIAKDCAPLGGDLWLVYMGNNEPTGVYGTSRVYSKMTPPLPMIRALLLLKKFRAGQMLDQAALLIGSEKSLPTSWGGMQMQADQFTRHSAPEMPRIYANFRANLDDILQAGSAAGAQAIVSTVAVNLKDCPPFASLHRADLPESDLDQWQKLFDEGVSAEASGDCGRAGPLYEQALAIDDTHAEAQFRLARCYLKQGKDDDANRKFQTARDLDALRLRADSTINDAIRETAAAHANSGALLLDAEAAFAQNSKEGPPGSDWFYEHVHFRFAGNYLLARLFAEQIEKALPKRLERLAAKKGEWLAEAECSKRLAFTAYSLSASLEDMIGRVEKLPFTRQADHAKIIAALRQELRPLLASKKPLGLARDADRCRAAVEAAPGDWVLRNLLAYMSISAGKTEAARDEWHAVTQLAPDFPAPYAKLASLAFDKGNFAEAEKFALSAVRLDAESSESHRLLGRVRERQGLLPQALSEFQKAARLDPGNPARQADIDRLKQAITQKANP
jgi:Flp pilus assembly protein TadD